MEPNHPPSGPPSVPRPVGNPPPYLEETATSSAVTNGLESPSPIRNPSAHKQEEAAPMSSTGWDADDTVSEPEERVNGKICGEDAIIWSKGVAIGSLSPSSNDFVGEGDINAKIASPVATTALEPIPGEIAASNANNNNIPTSIVNKTAVPIASGFSFETSKNEANVSGDALAVAAAGNNDVHPPALSRTTSESTQPNTMDNDAFKTKSTPDQSSSVLDSSTQSAGVDDGLVNSKTEHPTTSMAKSQVLAPGLNITTKVVSQADGRHDCIEKQKKFINMVETEEKISLKSINASFDIDVSSPMKVMPDTTAVPMMPLHQPLNVTKDAPTITMPRGDSLSMDVEASNVKPSAAESSGLSSSLLLGGSLPVVDNGIGSAYKNDEPSSTSDNYSALQGETDRHNIMQQPPPPSAAAIASSSSVAAPAALASTVFNSVLPGRNFHEMLSSDVTVEQRSAPSLASSELIASSSSDAVVMHGNNNNNSIGETISSGTKIESTATLPVPSSATSAPFAQPPTNNNSVLNAPVNNASTSSSIVNNNVLHPTGRELKVEDALLYLDQVKLEFGDRPRIYNEFLEIMKNFKAQEVDTIGVINRVRTLFHGYNNLILGFNTFLPEGYKIEMRDLEPVFVGPGLSGTSHTPGYKPPPGPGGGGGRGMPPGRNGPPQQHPSGGRGMGQPPPAFGRNNIIGGRGIPPPGRGMMGRGPSAGPSGRGMPVSRGGPPPQIGGPGRGMSLPGGRGGIPQSAQGRMQPTPLQPLHMQAHNIQQKQTQIQLQPNQQQEHQSMAIDASQQRNATRTIEFDHAIMYVTNIKKRFANQPRIYHTFLEILHTYQKEQRGIKEVLEQVSSLFADHPDLLREFTFFLPDAVQEQAKERLSRAAAEAEAKQRAAAVEAAAKHHQAQVHHASAVESGKLKTAPTGWRATANVGAGAIPKVGKVGQNVGMEPSLPSGTHKFIDMTQPEGAGFESTRRPSASGVSSKKTTQQDLFVYNAGVERQFFDLVKAALTSFSRDGQAYAEFIKTLDMYAQEILSRNDMLGYVERLLGKHKDLFEEFKRIINAVGSSDAPTHDDSWHSVPLSEIDFSRCRRCSPSYRALPRDYPNPPCSERSEDESKVLNDIWVSLPMGSEENSTFRHMRKNQYEETLFQCEDMRFEIDMCIDSNAATLQRLIKISDELQFLSKNELLFTKGSSVKKSLVPDGAGFGGKIYQYTLDGRVLGIIHKLAIKRIYGDDGNEMLELCFKNPAVALPIVVNRLRQKDNEWRAARDMLNKKWKDLAELNYYMSLDHRSITWRATDKRATSTRSLVAEIKDRATHNGFEGEAARSARIEKAKEEHGAFYEVTMGCAVPRKMDLAGLPLPTRTIFTPHMSFVYDNTSWAQHDAYRLISFALERGSVNPSDKERCHRLWCDFIGPWFGLSLSWMQSPAALFTGSFEPLEEDDDAESMSSNNEEKECGNDNEGVGYNVGEINTDNGKSTVSNGKVVNEEMTIPNSMPTISYGYFSKSNHVPFPPETFVSTTFGEGKIIQYIEQDGVYEVSIPPESEDASTAYLRIDAIYGTLFPVEPSLLTEQLRENDQEVPERAGDQLIIGTQCLYLFFRLHQILIRRLTVAKKLAYDVSNDLALEKHIEKITSRGDITEGGKRYGAFLDLVYSLIDTGSAEASEGGKYEDRVMHLLGNNAFELTTMDKLISHVLKHLQNMANDDVLQNMIEVYRRHRLAGSFKPSAFREEASLMSDGESMFAFQICDITQTDQKICHCEFLGCIAEDVEDEDNVGTETIDSKRGINDIDMDDADVCAHDSKRIKRSSS